MTMLELESRIVEMLKTVFDPEIPVNVYDLGLIYRIEDMTGEGDMEIDMTLTAPNCPAADFIADDVKEKVESVDGVKSLKVNIVYEPEWNRDMMSEEAQLELGML
ncbi:MAG: metal-sulfur cluster assembly factor [Paludibacteraceae bacterium]|nr:metal-sulfur cluster assembly factor [Paludibacteraceae bacterium]